MIAMKKNNLWKYLTLAVIAISLIGWIGISIEFSEPLLAFYIFSAIVIILANRSAWSTPQPKAYRGANIVLNLCCVACPLTALLLENFWLITFPIFLLAALIQVTALWAKNISEARKRGEKYRLPIWLGISLASLLLSGIEAFTATGVARAVLAFIGIPPLIWTVIFAVNRYVWSCDRPGWLRVVNIIFNVSHFCIEAFLPEGGFGQGSTVLLFGLLRGDRWNDIGRLFTLHFLGLSVAAFFAQLMYMIAVAITRRYDKKTVPAVEQDSDDTIRS